MPVVLMGAVTVHNLESGESLERWPLDMALVTELALATKMPTRRYHLEFDCGGHAFIWEGAADCEREAIALGRLALEVDGRFDSTARLAICLERRA